MKLELYYPVKTDRAILVSQPFGVNGEYYQSHGINIKGHNGVDMRATHGQIVRAAHDGMVVYAGMDSSAGIGVVIRTTEPFEYINGESYFKTIYWHLINNIPVKVGQRVKTGDIIGYADNTGLSTADHLHFGLKPQIQGENDWTWLTMNEDNGYGGAIDPMPYFPGFYAEDKQTVVSILQQQISVLQKVVELYKKIIG